MRPELPGADLPPRWPDTLTTLPSCRPRSVLPSTAALSLRPRAVQQGVSLTQADLILPVRPGPRKSFFFGPLFQVWKLIRYYDHFSLSLSTKGKDKLLSCKEPQPLG